MQVNPSWVGNGRALRHGGNEKNGMAFRAECTVTAMMIDTPSAQRRPHQTAAQTRS